MKKVSVYREAAERLPEAQPEYWGERVMYRDMGILDDNQRLRAERIVRRLLAQDPGAELDDVTNYAIKQARETVPTIKQAAMAVAELRNGPTYCYLAFYGLRGVASFLKVGISNHPERRMYGIATGNPLDCLWVFAARFVSRSVARSVEQALIRHFSARKRRGEWLHLDGVSEEAATGMARQMGILAGEVSKSPVRFGLLGYTDGRSVA